MGGMGGGADKAGRAERAARGHAGRREAGPPLTRTTAYTDGACLGNPGPGGWAYAVSEGRFRSGAENPSTNQRMEITAALRAVEDLDGDLEIVSDSTYVVNCFRDKWWQAWIQRGWLTAAKKPV